MNINSRRGGKRRRSMASSGWSDTSLVTNFLVLVTVIVFVLNVMFFATVQTKPSRKQPSRLAKEGIIYNSNNFTTEDTNQQEKIVSIFHEAGVELDEASLRLLPSWSRIQEEIGGPVLYNLESCKVFRETVHGEDRNIGCSGMFNSGTNLITQLLKQNCRIPERVEKFGVAGPFHDSQGKPIGPFEAHGMRWQVPWGKHVPANYRDDHSTKFATHIEKDGVLAVVTIRHPYQWMKSMCKNPYTAKWQHSLKCPHLGDHRHHHVDLRVHYDGPHDDVHDSLAHLWNDWYARYYKDATFPYVMVRFEDMIFHAKNVTTQLCECAGGVIRTDRPFQYIKDSAKEGPGHGNVKDRTGMVDAWIRYSQPLPPGGGFHDVMDYEKSKEFLNPQLMEMFHYKHAPPPPP